MEHFNNKHSNGEEKNDTTEFNHPELAPQFLDVNEFKNDVQAVETLRSIHSPLEQIAEMLSDSMTLAGSDAYAAALMFYGSVKSAKKSNVAKAAPIYDDLAGRFPTRKLGKQEPRG
ncbi:MAG TPA: hypothetical protein PK293_03110 [Spirochaetota bacterium]|nr:hypothetical protein [Spirochaetota bacterium]